MAGDKDVEPNWLQNDVLPEGAEVAPLPTDQEWKAAWEHFDRSSRCTKRVKNQVLWMLHGYGFKEAAIKAGTGGWQSAQGAIERWGLSEWAVSTKRIIRKTKQVAEKALDLSSERLDHALEDPLDVKRISTRDVALIQRDAANIIRDHDQWRYKGTKNNEAVSALDRAVEAAIEGRVNLEISVTPADRSPHPVSRDPGPIIDVTPKEKP